ncbi:hypothetical protein R6Q59_029305 [Mikania micrantha]
MKKQKLQSASNRTSPPAAVDGVSDVLPTAGTSFRLISPDVRLSSRHPLAVDHHLLPQRPTLLLLSLGKTPAPPRTLLRRRSLPFQTYIFLLGNIANEKPKSSGGNARRSDR